MNKIKVAGSGLDGLVGSRIVELLKDNFEFNFFSKDEMDIRDRLQVKSILKKADFDIFLHLAAYTDVDNAEINKELAWSVNVEGTKNVFNEVIRQKKKFIYISTDYVFDGKKEFSDEDSIPNPLCFYGLTKYEGEKIVGDKGMIVRISYPYRAKYDKKKDVVRNIIANFNQNKKIFGVFDNKITPTFIDDISYALNFLINNFSPEIYHIVGGESLSGFNLVIQICEVFGFDKSQVSKLSAKDFYQGKATRPINGTILSRKNNFHPMKSLKEGLKSIKKQGILVS